MFERVNQRKIKRNLMEKQLSKTFKEYLLCFRLILPKKSVDL